MEKLTERSRTVPRSLPLVFAILALCGLLSALGCTEKQALEPITLTMWLDASDGELEFYKSAAGEYGKANPRVSVEFVSTTFADLKPKLLGRPLSATAPDIVFLVHDWIGELATKKVLRPLAKPKEVQLEQSVQGLTYEDSLYALPMSFGVVSLIYNRALVKKAPQNFVELVAMARRLKSTKNVIPLLYDNKNFYYHAPFFFGFGAKLFDEKGRCSLSSPEAIESINFSLNLERDEIVPLKANHSAMVNMFCSGQVAMIITGPWDWVRIKQSGVEAAVAPLPLLPKGQKPKPFIGIHGFAITSSSQQAEQARKFIDFLTSPKIQRRALDKLGRMPTAISIYGDATIPKPAQVFFAQAQEAISMPNGPEMVQVWQQMNWAMARCFTRKETPEVILRKVSTTIDAMSAKSRGRIP